MTLYIGDIDNAFLITYTI